MVRVICMGRPTALENNHMWQYVTDYWRRDRKVIARQPKICGSYYWMVVDSHNHFKGFLVAPRKDTARVLAKSFNSGWRIYGQRLGV